MRKPHSLWILLFSIVYFSLTAISIIAIGILGRVFYNETGIMVSVSIQSIMGMVVGLSLTYLIFKKLSNRS